MFKKLLFICTLSGVIGCGTLSPNGEYKAYYNNDTLISIQSFRRGMLNGISRQYYDTGELMHAIEYKNDEIHGMYNTYYPNGSLWINEFFDQGNVIGRREYDEEGLIVRESGHGW